MRFTRKKTHDSGERLAFGLGKLFDATLPSKVQSISSTLHGQARAIRTHSRLSIDATQSLPNPPTPRERSEKSPPGSVRSVPQRLSLAARAARALRCGRAVKLDACAASRAAGPTRARTPRPVSAASPSSRFYAQHSKNILPVDEGADVDREVAHRARHVLVDFSRRSRYDGRRRASPPQLDSAREELFLGLRRATVSVLDPRSCVEARTEPRRS